MSIVSMIWTWQEGGRIYSRLTTNVKSVRLLARLTALEVLDRVETIHAFFGDRVDGGTGYEVLWKTDVDWSDLRTTLPKL